MRTVQKIAEQGDGQVAPVRGQQSELSRPPMGGFENSKSNTPKGG